jgi:hypothetical protein
MSDIQRVINIKDICIYHHAIHYNTNDVSVYNNGCKYGNKCGKYHIRENETKYIKNIIKEAINLPQNIKLIKKSRIRQNIQIMINITILKYNINIIRLYINDIDNILYNNIKMALRKPFTFIKYIPNGFNILKSKIEIFDEIMVNNCNIIDLYKEKQKSYNTLEYNLLNKLYHYRSAPMIDV